MNEIAIGIQWNEIIPFAVFFLCLLFLVWGVGWIGGYNARVRDEVKQVERSE